MKKILTLICTLLCANVLLAQDYFLVGQLYYSVTSNSSVMVYGYNRSNPPTDLFIPSTITYQGTTYSVTAIDYEAFRYSLNGGDVEYSPCTTLTSVIIPNSVIAIGNYAFYGCSSLTSVTISNSVTSIGEGAFFNCSSLTSVTIPNSVTSIGDGVFSGCSSLTSVNISNSVTSIGNYAFFNCSSLTSITIPNSITSIGNRAFYGCSSLTSVTIPNSVTSIGGGVFYNCSSLTSVTLSNNITELPCDYKNGVSYGLFSGCSSLTSVTIPNSVTSIGDGAFFNCSSLTSVTIPDSVTYIGFSAFEYCESLTSVTIPNTVTSIGNYAFSGCSSLTSVTIEMNNIPNLGNIGLNYTLQNLTLGENVVSIASGAFNNYSFLQNVTCLATNPPALADNTVFPYPNIATLTVPCGALEAYSSPTSFWNMFFAGRISESGYNVEVSVNDETFGSVAVESDCSTGTLTATANEGYRFVIWNDGNTDNPRTVALTSDTSFSAIFALIDESSLAEDAEFAEISLYPNPTNSKVSFNQTIEKVEVIDLSGKILFTFSNANSINIESLPSGAYYLRLTNKDKAIMQKIIKE